MTSLSITNLMDIDLTNSKLSVSQLETEVNIGLHSFGIQDLVCTYLLSRYEELGSFFSVFSKTWVHNFPDVALNRHGMQARLRSPLAVGQRTSIEPGI